MSIFAPAMSVKKIDFAVHNRNRRKATCSRERKAPGLRNRSGADGHLLKDGMMTEAETVAPPAGGGQQGDFMRVLTVYQPWASLIIAGAKPYEFRGKRPPASYIGTRIAIHAGARPMELVEVRALLQKLHGGRWKETGLVAELAVPILERARTWLEWRRRAGAFRAVDEVDPAGALPLSSILGVALLAHATQNPMVRGHYLVEDSDRTEHMNWGWRLTSIGRLEPPLPHRGRQGWSTISNSAIASALRAPLVDVTGEPV